MKLPLRPWGRGVTPNLPNPNMTIAEPHVESGSRSPVLTTDSQLHTGREPAHIDRIKRADLYGYIAPRGVNNNAQADANMRFLGHVPLVHRVTGVPPSYGVTMDDRSYIPAVMAGNPSESPS